MSIDQILTDKSNISSEITDYTIKKSLKERLFAILAPIGLSAVIGMYGADTAGCGPFQARHQPSTKAEITNYEPIVVKSSSYQLEKKLTVEMAKEEDIKFYPSLFDQEEKQRIYSVVLDAVEELNASGYKVSDSSIPLYLAIIDAESNFQADEYPCRLISSGGAVGHMQLLRGTVPNNEKTLRFKSPGQLRRFCRGKSIDELAKHDVRFNDQKNIEYGIIHFKQNLAIFRPGVYTYYAVERKGRLLGRISRGNIPEDALYSHTIRISTQRDMYIMALAGYNQGPAGTMADVARLKPANPEVLLRKMHPARRAYVQKILSRERQYSRMMSRMIISYGRNTPMKYAKSV